MIDPWITIHLTDHPPVRIHPDLWPVIARKIWFNGPTSQESTERAYVRVRQNNDGRVIVYGLRVTEDREVMAGYLVSNTEAMTTAIKNTCALVGLESSELFAEMPTMTL